ncbi:uncharacterized protein VTP21DRAFT_2911 [Calcarisporiella thermophila]|uniref:uncharacterized protein n=1 Tax=Calcarisporiella thermophila TaxID=911321 RepID=UPI0037445763
MVTSQVSEQKLHALSNLDHIATPVYVTIYLLYPNTSDIASVMNDDSMKASLAKLLALNPILAGRLEIHGNSPKDKRIFVNYSEPFTVDEMYKSQNFDACYSELEQNGFNLDHEKIQFHRAPEPGSMSQPLIQAQLTRFRDGGILLAVSISHLIADGKAMANIVRVWSEINRGKSARHFVFENANLAPTCDAPTLDHTEFGPVPTISKGDQFQKRSVYLRLTRAQQLSIKADIQALRSADDKGWISTHDALSAILWRAYARALGLSKSTDILRLVVVKNLRADAGLPVESMGNLLGIFMASATGDVVTDAAQLWHLARISWKAKRRYDAAIYLQSLSNAIEQLPDKCFTHVVCADLGMNDIGINDWASLGFDLADFGTGTPQRVRLPDTIGPPFLLPVPGSDGDIEVRLSNMTSIVDAMVKDEYVSKYLTGNNAPAAV